MLIGAGIKYARHLHGNITGQNSLCSGGAAPATGLVLTTLIDGPIAKVYELTSVKDTATYRMTYRFLANAPYYQYDLMRTGTTASVMNNFWYLDGSFTRLGTRYRWHTVDDLQHV